MKYFRFSGSDIAIDLGTANTLVACDKQGIIINEPTVVAIDVKKKNIIAIGKEAKLMVGKTPDNIVTINPLADGVISDFDITQALIEYCIKKANPGFSLFQPRIIVSVPSGSTDVENRAIQDACLQAGARDVFLLEESIASAYGSGYKLDSTDGTMVLNMGAGTTEVAVVAMYGIVTSEVLKHGGNELDKKIMEYIREKYNLVIGINTAEKLKIGMASLKKSKQNEFAELSGRDKITGMPKTIKVFTSDITFAILPWIKKLIEAIHITLEKTPPELSSDILKSGLMITGGTSLLDGLSEFLSEELGIKVTMSKNPLTDTVKGSVVVSKSIDKYKNKRKDK